MKQLRRKSELLGKTVLLICLFLLKNESSISQSSQVQTIKKIAQGFEKIIYNGQQGYFVDTSRFTIATYKVIAYHQCKELETLYSSKAKTDSSYIETLKEVINKGNIEREKQNLTIKEKDDNILILKTKVKGKNKTILITVGVGIAELILIILK